MRKTMAIMARTAIASENEVKMGIDLGHGTAYGCRLREKTVRGSGTEVERSIC